MPNIHIIIIMDDGEAAEFCVPVNDAQYYIEKFEADGCTFDGYAPCPGPECIWLGDSFSFDGSD